MSAGYGPPDPLPSLSTVTIDNQTGFGLTLSMPVTVDTQLVCVAVGASGANTFALGGSIALDYIRQTIEANIESSSTVTVTGNVIVTAVDDSSIGMGAGGAGIAKGTNSFGKAATPGLAAIGAAVADNDIANNLTAEIANSSVTSSTGNLSVLGQEQAAITGVAIGGSFAQNFSLGGSVAVNAIDNSIMADVSASNATATSGSVTVSASDTSQIETIAGALSLAVALKSGSAVSAALGASVAISSIGSLSQADAVTATIENGSTVSATDSVSVTATASPAITSFSIAGAASGDFGEGGAALGIDGAGAGSSNKIYVTVQALIETSSTVTTTNSGDVYLTASDTASIEAIAGGVALAGAYTGGEGAAGIAVSVGAAVAINDITADTFAEIESATVNSAGAVDLSALNSATILAVAVGVAGSLAGGGNVGVAFGGAGSGTGCDVTDETEALILNSGTTPSIVTSGTDVDLTATESPGIVAAAGTLAFSVALASGDANVAPAIGVSVAINSITATVTANINDSTVTAGGNVLVSAQTQPPANDESIKAITVAGGVAVGGSEDVGVAFAGAGAGSSNTLNNTVTASITSCEGTNSLGKPIAVTATGNITLSALDNSSILADGGGATVSVAVGTVAVAPGIGAGFATNTINNSTNAYIDASQVAATGQVSLSAKSTPDIEATAFGVAVSVAFSGEVGVAGAGSGASASNTITNTVEAYIQDGSTVSAASTATDAVSLTATDQPTYTATSGSGSLGFTVGQASVALAVGVSIAENTVTTNNVKAYIGTLQSSGDGTSVTTNNGGLTVTASSNQTITAKSVAVAATIAIPINLEFPLSVALSGSGASSTNTITNTIAAAVDGGASIHVLGAALVTADDTPNVNAEATGAAVSVGLIGVAIAGVVSNSSITANVSSYLGNNTDIACGSLTLQASQSPDTNSDPTAQASSTAGSGGLLLGVDAATSTVFIGGSVQAYTGSGVTLPDGDIIIAANNNTSQSANALGVAVGGLLAVGGNVTNASSDVATSAYLGANPIMSSSRSGSLIVMASGLDTNAASTTAGSGGYVGVDAADATTKDESTVTASLTSGTSTAPSTIYAGNVTVSAMNVCDYAPSVNSVNAAIIGGSGAVATNTDSTSATTTIGNDTTIVALGLVEIGAQNEFAETTSGASASAGAGGSINGTAAKTDSQINQNVNNTPFSSASVSLGTAVNITSGTNPFTNAGGIVIEAISALVASDLVTLTTGGLIQGAGVNSELDATLNNTVVIGSSDTLTSSGNIGVGTYTRVNAGTNGEVNTYGLAAVGVADATTDVTSNQNVTVNSGATLEAFGNINLLAGNDPIEQSTTNLSGSSNAQALAEGVAGIPTINSTTTLTSDTTLTISTGATILSGQDVTIGAFPGNPLGNENGASQGSVLYIPIRNTPSNDPTITTTSTVTQDGAITAGIFHDLSITIPANPSNPPQVTVASSGPAGFTYPTPSVITAPQSYAANFPTTSGSSSTPSYAPNAGYYTDFNPDAFVNTYFTGVPAQTLLGGVSSGIVNAYVLPALFASGGQVTINAATLNGSGTLVANADPTITINDEGSDYLVVNAITIPDIAAGQVLFTGAATASDDTSLGITQDTSSALPTITINLSYQASAGSNGPGLFLMGTIDNEGGNVSINNATGSLGQTAGIYAESVGVSVPNGVGAIDIPNGPWAPNTYGDPSSQWSSQMIWPGGNPATTTLGGNVSAANQAINYVADSVQNAAQYSSQTSFIEAIVGNWTTEAVVDQSPENKGVPPSIYHNSSILGQASLIYIGDSVPFLSSFSGGSDSQSANTGSSLGLGTSAYQIYTASNPTDVKKTFYGDQYSTSSGYTPYLNTNEPLSETLSSYPAPSTANTIAAYTTNALSVTAEWIDMNGQINVGKSTNSSVQFAGASLQNALQTFQDQFDAGTETNPVLNISSYLTTIASGDNPISATYNAQTRRIIVANVTNSNGGTVYFNGKIISTYTTGTNNVHFNGGPGQITINNQLGALTIAGAAYQIPVVIQNVDAGVGANVDALDIVDENFSPAKQTLYVYQPQQGQSSGTIQEYVGTAGETLGSGTPTATTTGNSATYQPEQDLVWEWQQTATLSRTEFGTPGSTSWGLNPWSFNFPTGSPNDPWQYTLGGSSNSATSDPLYAGETISKLQSADTIYGGVRINETQFSGQSAPNVFYCYAYNDNVAITPLLFQVNADGSYSLAVIYQSVTINTYGGDEPANAFQLKIASGTINPSATYVFGFWNDNGNGQEDNGTIAGQAASSSDNSAWLYSNESFSSLSLNRAFSTSGVSGSSPVYGGWTYAAGVSLVVSGTTPVGYTAIDSSLSSASTSNPVFKQTISGTYSAPGSSIPNEFAYNVYYSSYVLSSDQFGWTYYYPMFASLTMTSEVRADNPISFNFSGDEPGSLTVTSTGPVILAGNINLGAGPVTITAQGSITEQQGDSIQAGTMNLTAAGGSIGLSTTPVVANLGTGGELNAQAGNQGVYLNLNSGAVVKRVVSGDATHGYGDVVIHSTGSLDAQPTSATVWVDDSTPPGSTLESDPGDNWNWISSNPTPYSGTLADQSNIASGEHQQYFYTTAAESLIVNTGNTLFAYVYLNPANPPSEVMLQWYVNGSWEHRHYWGADDIGWGTNDTVSRVYMGSLPATGTWVRLEVPASVVGLDGATVSGMAFTLFNGQATWDQAGTATASFVAGDNITLSSSTGGVGTSANPLILQANSVAAANGGVIGGVVTVTAQQDIGLLQSTGDLLVGDINSTSGNIYLDAPGGSIYGASTWTATGPTLAQAQQVWTNLQLTDPTAAQQSVTAFENLVESDYQQYWQLLENGTVANGAYALAPANVPLYSAQAATSLNVANPTSDQVEQYTSQLYQQLITFFDANLAADWMTEPDFVTLNPNYQYTATPEQVAALTKNAVSTDPQLIYSVASNALSSSSGSSNGTPKPVIQGASVTLSAGSGVGKNVPPTFIPVSELQDGTLTPEQNALIAQATAGGDVLYVQGINAQGQTVQFPIDQPPAGVTVTGIELSLIRPVYVSVANTLNVSAESDVNIDQTSGNLTVGQVSSTSGTVQLTAPGSILEQANVNGFGGNGTDWTTNSIATGYPTIANNILTLTNGNGGEASSAWFNTPVPTGSFTASFTYTDVNGHSTDGDGSALVFQNQGLAALALRVGVSAMPASPATRRLSR